MEHFPNGILAELKDTLEGSIHLNVLIFPHKWILGRLDGSPCQKDCLHLMVIQLKTAINDWQRFIEFIQIIDYR